MGQETGNAQPNKSTRNENLRLSAERRAQVVAFVSKLEGVAVTAEQIAEKLGITSKQAAYTAKQLSESGLIAVTRKGLANMYSPAKGTNGAARPAAGPPAATMGPLTPILSGTPKKGAQAAKEIELVVSGVLVVIGRNEQSGRIRITIEG